MYSVFSMYMYVHVFPIHKALYFVSSIMYMHIQSDIENCEGWLSSSGHSSGGRALTAKVRGPGSILGGCQFFTVL